MTASKSRDVGWMGMKEDRDVGKNVMKRNRDMWEACKIINYGNTHRILGEDTSTEELDLVKLHVLVLNFSFATKGI